MLVGIRYGHPSLNQWTAGVLIYPSQAGWASHQHHVGMEWDGTGRGGASATTWKEAFQSLYPEPGSSLVKVCQRSIFLSLFFRQSNQCFSLSPLAFIPKETPPGEKVEEFIKTAKNNQRTEVPRGTQASTIRITYWRKFQASWQTSHYGRFPNRSEPPYALLTMKWGLWMEQRTCVSNVAVWNTLCEGSNLRQHFLITIIMTT